jgi:hypothetical protein
VLQILINDIKSDTICVPKYKISMIKSLVLIKLIVIINLLMVKVVFTIVSFMREIFLCFINVFIVKCRKRYRINRGMFGKVIINNVVKNSKSVL